MNQQQIWTIAKQTLTPKQLEACQLVWLQHLPSRDAALLLGISHGALQERLRNARHRLHTELARKDAA